MSAKAKLCRNEADVIWRDFENSPPPLSSEEMLHEIEARAEDDGRQRRIALALLRKSGRDLIEMTSDREQAFLLATMVVYIRDYEQRLKMLRSLMTTAVTRARVALCNRVDMEALIKEAEQTAYD
jgi:hypothetical protein